MKKKLYCSPDRKICGVCGGIADYFDIDPTLVRLIAVEIAFFTAILPLLLFYLIAAIIIPQAPQEDVQAPPKPIKRITKGSDKKIAGVCSGIAAYFNMDPTLVRLLFVLLFLLIGNGLYTYVACAIIFPPAEEPQSYEQPPYAEPMYGQPQPEQQPEQQPYQPPQNDAQ